MQPDVEQLDDDQPFTSRDMLGMFSGAVLQDMVDEDAFRKAIGLSLRGSITLGAGSPRFDRADFFEKIRHLYGAAQDAISVDDEEGKSWFLEQFAGGGLRLHVRNGADIREIPGFMGLHPDAVVRLAEFDAALIVSGFDSEGLPSWRAVIEERALRDEEVKYLDEDLALTPLALGQEIERQFGGPTGHIELIAPPQRAYYDNLVGHGTAETLEELVTVVLAPKIDRLISTKNPEVIRLALLLALHSSVVPASRLAELPDVELLALIDWAKESGDLFSRVGAIEVGLMALPRSSALEPGLIALIESIRDADPGDVSGRLYLLTGILAFVGGDLTRTQALDDVPPFRRRLAIFAQASLFERYVFGHIDVKGFTRWALDQRMRGFYFQGLIDLRREPRWLPDFITAEQLRAELLGRINNTANLHTANIAEGPLRELLFGAGGDSIVNRLEFPGSFLPGPLEGMADDRVPPLPKEFASIVEDTLADDDFGPRSITALINLRGLFKLGDAQVERAVELIRTAGHRFDATVDQEARQNLFIGLAGVASGTRNPALAEELRVMVRKNRIDSVGPHEPRREFMIAVMAAAAHEAIEPWATFIGEWGAELAFGVTDKGDAANLYADMALMCVIESRLGRVLSKPMTALEAFTLN